MRRFVVLIALALGASMLVAACGDGEDGTPTTATGRIAFISNRDGNNGDIYVMNADGSDPTRLTNSYSVEDGSPDWSQLP